MRLPRIRFTVRRLMVAVAVAAVALGANDLRRRRERFLTLGATHKGNARVCVSSADWYASTAAANEREAERLRAALRSNDGAKGPHVQFASQMASTIEAAAADQRAEERKHRDRARVHDALRIKYERAARSPWLPVPPDSPTPE